MIFDNVKSIVIPEGSVKEITCNNVTLWQKIRIIIETVSGVGTIVLQKVIQLVSITQYGKCEQASTPTPSVPVDIKCNNGKLGIISEGVPIEYIRVEYLQSSGTQYIDTGVAINYATQKIEQRATAQYTTSNTNRELMGSNGYGFWGKNASNKLESAAGNAVTVTESALNKNTVSLITDPTNNSVTFVVNSNRYESTASTLADNYYACYVFALGGRSGAAASFFCNAKVYEYTIILDDVVVSHLIPVKRRSDGVLGMYDTVTNSFKVNAGTGTFTAGNAIGSIGVVGTPEVLTVSGANLLDPTTVLSENQFINKNTGGLTLPSASGGVWRHSDYIPVVGGETYYFHQINATATTAGTAWYDSEQTYIGGINATALANADNKVTMPANAAYLRHSWRIDEDYNTDWENTVYICLDGALSKFQPYATPQTASVVNLLAVGDTKDEQEIISGGVTHKVGVKVFDGTENWTLTSSSSGCIVFSVDVNAHSIQGWSKITSLCTHFECYVGNTSPTYIVDNVGKFWFNTTGQYFRFVTDGTMSLSQFKAFLAAQYANGTPVIVVYPLAEAIEESVTPQSFTVSETTIISAESDYVDDIALSGTYETPEA